MELTRKQIIDNLSYIADSMPDDACGDWRDSLAYAISSLKTDEAYQIMYEGGEIYTKDEVIDMFNDLKAEIGKTAEEVKNYDVKWALGLFFAKKIVQEKINVLKEPENEIQC